MVWCGVVCTCIGELPGVESKKKKRDLARVVGFGGTYNRGGCIVGPEDRFVDIYMIKSSGVGIASNK